jgi:addiction module RelB/DinJ family antitoxin
MAKTTINIKADTEVKKRAQRVAESLGMPLSTVINAYLKQFIRTKEVHFFTEGRVKPEVRKRLDRLRKEALEGKNLSPAFESAEEAIRYLNS